MTDFIAIPCKEIPSQTITSVMKAVDITEYTLFQKTQCFKNATQLFLCLLIIPVISLAVA